MCNTSRLYLDRGLLTDDDWEILAGCTPKELASYHIAADNDYRKMLKGVQLSTMLNLDLDLSGVINDFDPRETLTPSSGTKAFPQHVYIDLLD